MLLAKLILLALSLSGIIVSAKLIWMALPHSGSIAAQLLRLVLALCVMTKSPSLFSWLAPALGGMIASG